jgi:hypothetical protein
MLGVSRRTGLFENNPNLSTEVMNDDFMLMRPTTANDVVIPTNNYDLDRMNSQLRPTTTSSVMKVTQNKAKLMKTDLSQYTHMGYGVGHSHYKVLHL